MRNEHRFERVTGRICMIWIASAAAAACSAAEDPSDSAQFASTERNLEPAATVGEEVEPLVPEDWFGHSIGASPGTWRYKGSFRVAGPDEEPMEYVLDLDAPSIPDDGPPTFVIGDPVTGQMHSVELALDALQLIADHLERLGYAEGNSGDAGSGPPGNDREAEDIVEKTWSNGTDQRNPLGLNEFAFNADPYRKIGQLLANTSSDTTTGTCTATFIGTPETDIYVITSAHCLWSSTGTYLDVDFIPRRDACLMPDGPDAGTTPDPLPNCDTTSPYTTTSIAPYGRWDGGQWMMDQYYIDNCIGVPPQTTACLGRDITVSLLRAFPRVAWPYRAGHAAGRGGTAPRLRGCDADLSGGTARATQPFRRCPLAQRKSRAASARFFTSHRSVFLAPSRFPRVSRRSRKNAQHGTRMGATPGDAQLGL